MELSTRKIKVKNWGTYVVPERISRIDTFTKNCHGWYARTLVSPNGIKISKFFSDSHYESPTGALQAAVDWLAKEAVAGGYMRIQEPYLGQKRKKGKLVKEIRLSVTNAVTLKTKTFYVGTENTATEERIAEVRLKALTYRESTVKKKLSMLKTEVKQLRAAYAGFVVEHPVSRSRTKSL